MTGFGDSDELIASGYTLSIPHPPGYPLLVGLIHLFSYVSFIPLSAVIMSLCMVMLYGVSMELLNGKHRLYVWITVIAVSITGLIWEHGTYIEAFSLNALLSMILLYLSILLKKQKKSMNRRYLLWGITAGIGLGHHQTFVLILFPVLLLLSAHLFRQRRLYKTGFMIAGMVSTFVFSYGLLWFLGLRNSPLSWQFDSSLAGLWRFYSRADYSGYVPGIGMISAWWSGFTLTKTIEAWQFYLLEMWRHWGAFGFIGIIGLFKAKKNYLLLAPWLIAGPLFAGYTTITEATFGSLEYETARAILERMYLLSEVWWGIFTVLGIVTIAEYARHTIGQRITTFFPAIMCTGLFGLIGLRYQNYDLSHYTAAEYYARNLVQNVPLNGRLICLSDVSCFGVTYVQSVLNTRADVSLMSSAPQYRFLSKRWDRFYYPDNPFRLGEAIGWSTYAGKPIYISQLNDYWARELGLNAEAFWLVPAGFTFEVLRSPPLPQNGQSVILPLPEIRDSFAEHHRFVRVIRSILAEQYVINSSIFARMGLMDKASKTVLEGLSTYPSDVGLSKMRQTLPEMGVDQKYRGAVDEYSYLRQSSDCRSKGDIACDLWQSRFMNWRNPENVVARLNFAVAFENAALKPLAKREYAHVLELDATNVQAQMGLKRLEREEDLR
jgi:hypothetical protein